MIFKLVQEMVSPNVIKLELYVSIEEDGQWKHIPVNFRTITEAKEYAVKYKNNYMLVEFSV